MFKNKRAGWRWDCFSAVQIKRYLVSFKYEPGVFRAHYAPDKTSLRKVLTQVSEIIEAPLLLTR